MKIQLSSYGFIVDNKTKINFISIYNTERVLVNFYDNDLKENLVNYYDKIKDIIFDDIILDHDNIKREENFNSLEPFICAGVLYIHKSLLDISYIYCRYGNYVINLKILLNDEETPKQFKILI